VAGEPEVRYARAGDDHIAYTVSGGGDRDVVLVDNWFSHAEAMWEWPAYAAALRRLGGMGRLLTFDKRGVGLSDPVPRTSLPTLEEWMDDVTTVMAAAGSERAALVGIGAGGPLCLLVAATHPDRVSSLVLVNAYARLARAPDHPFGVPDRLRDRLLEPVYANPDLIVGPGVDARFRSWWSRYMRLSVSPGTALVMRRFMFEVDVRQVLPSIRTPTLVVHRRDDPWILVDHGRHLARCIEGARYVEQPGSEDLFFLGDADAVLDEVEEHVTGSRREGLVT
jgi:pimeloyl-ACP methyl ester carboxylesterase